MHKLLQKFLAVLEWSKVNLYSIQQSKDVKFERETFISVCLAAFGLRCEKFVSQFLLWKKNEQRVCLKICVSNGNTATESLKMLQKFFGESTLSRTQVFEWHKAFSEGCEVVENLLHASRPSTSVNDENIEKVKKIVLEKHSTHCVSFFGYKARRRQARTERP